MVYRNFAIYFSEDKTRDKTSMLLKLPMNHHSLFLNTSSSNESFKKSLENILKDDTFSHTIGISIPLEILEHLEEFCQNILTAVENLSQNHKRPSYILLLFVETSEMQKETVKILKDFAKSNFRFLPRSGKYLIFFSYKCDI